jgi:hypothetical protein
MVVHPSAVLEGGHPMFDHNCTACATRQLIFPSQVTSLTNTDHGIVVDFTCWCGADQTITTGRAAERGAALAA